MYRIGLFSKMTKTTIKTLRYYEKMGLLIPNYIETSTGYRYYTTQQIVQFYEILSYRQAGLAIEQIKQIIIDEEAIEAVLDTRKQELIALQFETEKQISRINYLLKEKKEGLFMEYKGIVKDLPACIVYSKQMVVKDYDTYFTAIPEIGVEVSKTNPDMKCTQPEYCFIEYLENEYKEKDIHIEYCEAVEKMGNDTETIKFKHIKSVKAVCVIHKGSYKNLNKAYAYAFKWMAENNYELAQHPRESYIDGIWNKENQEDWLTELQFPIKKIK